MGKRGVFLGFLRCFCCFEVVVLVEARGKSWRKNSGWVFFCFVCLGFLRRFFGVWVRMLIAKGKIIVLRAGMGLAFVAGWIFFFERRECCGYSLWFIWVRGL